MVFHFCPWGRFIPCLMVMFWVLSSEFPSVTLFAFPAEYTLPPPVQTQEETQPCLPDVHSLEQEPSARIEHPYHFQLLSVIRCARI